MKILYIDVETTGLDWNLHGIVQLAFIIEVDGQVVEQHQFKMLPFIEDEIDHKAIKIHGIGRAFPITAGQPIASPKGSPGFRFEWHEDQRPATDVWRKVKAIWSKYIDKFDSQDKFIVAGYNCQAFDIPFLRKWIEKCEPETKFSVAGSFLGHTCIDPLPILQMWKVHGSLYDMPNLKLATVCQELDIDLEEAHDALSDIKATRILVKRMFNVYDSINDLYAFVANRNMTPATIKTRLEMEGDVKPPPQRPPTRILKEGNDRTSRD